MAAVQARDARNSSPADRPGRATGLPGISSTRWQRERAKRLHRICKRIKARVAAGQSLHEAIRTFSRRWNGKALKCDPSRRYALSVARLYQHYRRWRLMGESPACFTLNYFPTNRRIPASVLVRFVEFCTKQEFNSFRAAWSAFCRRGRNAGPGRVNGKKLKLGYHSLYWNLPKGCFAAFKRCWKSIRQSQRQIQVLRIKYTAEIRAHVPDRLPRRRVKQQPDWQI